MRHTVLIAFLATLFLAPLSASASQFEPKIVNGQPASGQNWPAVGALVDASKAPDRGRFCGASLIAPRWAITAAHCLGLPGVKIDIVFQRPDLRFNTGPRRAVVKSFISPKYNPLTGSADYGLLYLNQAVTGVKPLKLASRPARSGQKLRIAGWGSTRFGGAPVDVLRQGTIAVRRENICQRAYEFSLNLETMFCAGTRTGVDSCQGDSGGPATDLAAETIFGLVSQGRGCGNPQYPGIYAQVSAAKKWINKVRSRGPGSYQYRQPGADQPYQPILSDELYAQVKMISSEPRRYRIKFILRSKEAISSASVVMPAGLNICPLRADPCSEDAGPLPMSAINSRLATLTVTADPGCYWFQWQSEFVDQRFASQSGRYELKTCRL